MNDVTTILAAIELGEPTAAEHLLPLVYEELRTLAAQRLAREQPGQTLQATALVHEAYLRLVNPGQAQHWNSRGHFFPAAAEAMRRILVENARRKQAGKHGGGGRGVELAEAGPVLDAERGEVLELDEALSCLAREDPGAARLVELRLFAGLSVEQAAEVAGMSRANAYRHW